MAKQSVGPESARDNILENLTDHPLGTRAVAMAGITAWHLGFDRSAVELFAALALDMCESGPGRVQ